MKILDKNENFGQKRKFWSKIEILVKNGIFARKTKFWSKMDPKLITRHLTTHQAFDSLGI